MAEYRRTSSLTELKKGQSSRNVKPKEEMSINRPSSVPQRKPPPMDLLGKEEEYKRLNAELEAKTAEIVRQAEEVMRGQSEVLSKPIPSHLSLSLDLEDDLDDSSFIYPGPAGKKPSAKDITKTKPPSTSKSTKQIRPPSGNQSKKGAKATRCGVSDDVAVMEDFASLSNTISNIEDIVEEGALHKDIVDDIMPSVGEEMGSEAQIRFLKAKIRVMQEELDRLSHECSKKDEENKHLISKAKELEEDRARLQRMTNVQQMQMEKHKGLTEEYSQKCDGLQQEAALLKKEIDSLKRAQKQAAGTHSTTEVRLNRTLEEVERYKEQLNKIKQSSKDSAQQEHQKIELLQGENRRLEKQKAELIAGFKKQLKLIDILKRQKMHFEAAKVLSFTEEEFMKALDWGTN